MIVKLEELTVPALMTMAAELDIPDSNTMNKNQLLDAIQQKLGVNEALIFVPVNATQDPYKKWSLRVSIAAGIIATAAAFASWCGTIAAINKNSDESRESAEFQWQVSIAYKIIERESKKHLLGVSLDDIRQQYVGEATSAKEVNLRKDKLSELELRKVLIQLLALKLVYQTAEDKYITARTAILPGGHLAVAINNAQLAIHAKLLTEKGRYTLEFIGNQVGTGAGAEGEGALKDDSALRQSRMKLNKPQTVSMTRSLKPSLILRKMVATM